MSAFMGGSAYAMANQVAEGYILVSQATLKRFNATDRQALEFELEKLLREIRADNQATATNEEVQRRHRKMSRINQAKLILKNAPRR